jgi:peptide/nickel transport system substrate-binding protein
MVNPPIPDKPQSAAPTGVRKLPAFRWQVIVLLVAGVLILGSIVFLLLHGGTFEPSAAPRDVTFIDTQTYTEAAVGRPVYVNPLLAESQADRDLASLLYCGLTHTDEYGQPVPDLAESWDISNDGLTYTFHLRADAKWHDGVAFTANDVAFTMGLLRDPDFPGPADVGAFWRTVETYAIDDKTVQFVLTQPLASFPEYAGIGILPAHLLGGINAADLPGDAINLQPVGTGPLWWESLTEDSDEVIVTLRPNDTFHDVSRRVQLDGLIFHYYPDPGHAFAALGEDAQGYGGLDADQLEAALESDDLDLYSARMPLYSAVIFNQRDAERLPFFQEEEVRRALWLSLDRQTLVSEALGAQALVSDSVIVPASWAFNGALTPVPYDTGQAAQLLDSAGWTLSGSTRAREGAAISFTLLVADTPEQQVVGDAIREQWRALGIDMEIESLEPADLLERLQAPDHRFDAALVEFSPGRLADPDPYAFWHDSQIESGQNYSGFQDREIDEALEIARSDPNGVRRTELYRIFQQAFIDKAAAVLLYNPVYHFAVSCQIDGVQLSILVDPSDRFRSLSAWRILPPTAAAAACAQ